MTDEEKKVVVLENLYEELRHYREKEFHTFLFAFPILAAGFLPDFQKIRALLFLLTLFWLAMIYYIRMNHGRMMRLKARIVDLQEQLQMNAYYGELEPRKWQEKKNHLGMFTYIGLLSAQVLILWRDIIRDVFTKITS